MDKPDCFGIWWEAVPGPDGNNCRQCIGKDKCLAKFATVRLPVARDLISPPVTLAKLAGHLEVSESAVLLAMAYTKRTKQTPVTAEKRKDKSSANSRKNKEKKKKQNGKKKKSNGHWEWGEHTHETRWNQERERHPLIAQLTPGMRIEKQHKGIAYAATVKKGGYVYEEKAFPTLHKLTEHIAGAHARRNTVGFWDLARRFGD